MAIAVESDHDVEKTSARNGTAEGTQSGNEGELSGQQQDSEEQQTTRALTWYINLGGLYMICLL
jgi:hypothetical protein